MNWLALFSLTLALTLADAVITGRYAFDALALQSGPIHLAVLKAAEGGLFLNISEQHAKCKGENSRATFYIKDSELFMYSDTKLVQQIGVERSQQGQGRIDYLVNAAMYHPRQYQFKGWSIETGGNLYFDKKSFQACPNPVQGSWTIWSTDYHNPAGNSGCLTFSARTYPNNGPVSCVYS